jgi:Ca2+/H+ antiporter
MNKKNKLMVRTTLFLLIFPAPSYAYLDPGTVSYLTTILVTAIVSILVYIKIMWSKLKNFFSKIKFRSKDVEP